MLYSAADCTIAWQQEQEQEEQTRRRYMCSAAQHGEARRACGVRAMLETSSWNEVDAEISRAET